MTARRVLPAAFAAMAVLGGLAAPAAAPATAAAQDALTLGDVGAGRCTPDPVAPGATTDCTFDLTRDAPLDPAGGPYVLRDTAGAGRNASHCHVEGGRLRCPGVPVRATGPDGDPDRGLTLEFGDRRRADAATVAVGDIVRRVRLRIADHAVVTPGVPLRYATPEDLPDGTWLQVTPRYGTDVVATLEVRATGGWNAEPVELTADRLGLAAGSYRLRLCLGPTASDCEPTGRSSTMQVIRDPLQPLVTGHNVPNADRINLVVAGHGFDSQRDVADVATLALDPDAGLVLVDDDGTRLDPDRAERAAAAGEQLQIHFGFFAIEPFSDEVDRFNLWLLPEQVDDPAALRHVGGDDAPPWVEGFSVDGHELTDVSVVTLAQDPPGAEPGSHAGRNDLHDVEGPVDRGELGFSGSTTWVGRDAPWRDVTTVAHELGHALFGLRDEYRDSSTSVPNYGYPNCAESRSQAEQWWGDRIGELDPMAERYREVVETYQPGLRDISDDLLTRWAAVGVHQHPCGSSGDGPTSFVPTQRGLMANELPVLGAVNRARVEQVLGLFSGQPEDGATVAPSSTPTPPDATNEPSTDPTSTPTPTPTPTAAPTDSPAPTPTVDPPTAPDDPTTGAAAPWPVLLLAAVGLLLVAGWLWRSSRRTEDG